MRKQSILKIGAYTLAGAVLAGALTYYNFIHKDAPESTLLAVGDVCPDFTLSKMAVQEDKYVITEETVSYADYQGKTLILNFWATWCSSCIAEIPHFNEFYEEYQSQGVELLVINGEPNGEYVLKKMNNEKDQNAASYTAWKEYACTFVKYGADNDILKLFEAGQSGALPVTVVVDENGEIRYAAEGDLEKEELAAIVTPLLG